MEENEKYPWRFPAEWEDQRGVMLTWPHEDTDWAPMLNEVLATYREIAKAIVNSRDLLYVVSCRPLEDNDVGTTVFSNIVCPTNDTWARDHGFLSLVRGDRNQEWSLDIRFPSVKLLDYRFNGWGEKFPAELDNAINRHFFEQHRSCKRHAEYVDHLDFVLEGGSIESDGQGTIFTTSSCLLAPHRNEPMTREQIEERLKRDLCAKRVLWIDHGHLAGDDTDGHIDTLVRIAPNDTLLYIGCDDPSDEHYDDLKAMEEQLRTFTTLDGQPYNLKKLPLPNPIYDDDGQRLPATYANFLVLQNSVLLPTYDQYRNDKAAHRILQECFPRRTIVEIDSRSLIRQHGSIHCCTMQFPRHFI